MYPELRLKYVVGDGFKESLKCLVYFYCYVEFVSRIFLQRLAFNFVFNKLAFNFVFNKFISSTRKTTFGLLFLKSEMPVY